MLRRKRLAVDLVREERVAVEKLVDRQAPLVRLLLLAVDAAIEAGEERFDRAIPDTRLLEQRARPLTPRQRAVPTASRSQGWLTTCGSTCTRPFPAHSIVTATSTAGRARRSSSESESGRSTRPPTSSRHDRRVDVRDVVVREEVVEPDRRDVPAERLERHAVVAGSELELLEADPLRQRTLAQAR